MNDFDQSERIDALSAELAAAKSRIGVLEQESQEWSEEGTRQVEMIRTLQTQLAAVTLDRDALSDELDSFKSENESFRAECVPLRNTVAELQGNLAAVTQERDTLLNREHIAWLCYKRHGQITQIVTCDSDAAGAFKVYRGGQ